MNFERILRGLMDAGVQGIECYYPGQSAELANRCAAFCRQNGLCITAGSDDHGEFNRIIDGVEYLMGAVMVGEETLDLRGII